MLVLILSPNRVKALKKTTTKNFSKIHQQDFSESLNADKPTVK